MLLFCLSKHKSLNGISRLSSKARYCKSPTEPCVQVVNDNENLAGQRHRLQNWSKDKLSCKHCSMVKLSVSTEQGKKCYLAKLGLERNARQRKTLNTCSLQWSDLVPRWNIYYIVIICMYFISVGKGYSPEYSYAFSAIKKKKSSQKFCYIFHLHSLIIICLINTIYWLSQG